MINGGTSVLSPARSLWLGEPFSVQFFHPGFLYLHPVIIHYVDRKGTHQFPFSPDLFEYGSHGPKGYLSQDHGFAGFRVHYPLNTPKYADELVAFLGASYFRALGRDLTYGISARGLAVDTAEDTGEEFPFFREFWILHPSSRAKEIVLYALLDSNSVTGAYEFTVQPGQETRCESQQRAFYSSTYSKNRDCPFKFYVFLREEHGL